MKALAGKAQFLYLAIQSTRFNLRVLHNVIDTRKCWSGTVKVTRQLHRDLQWWKEVPTEKNGAPIWRQVETQYLHCDSSSFGWGAVLNEQLEARGYWFGYDIEQHITWKELKAVRLAVLSFLPLIRHHCLLLHEDNLAVVAALTHWTSRSPTMMSELRKLRLLLDENGISLPTVQYIRSCRNIWADALSRHRTG